MKTTKLTKEEINTLKAACTIALRSYERGMSNHDPAIAGIMSQRQQETYKIASKLSQGELEL